MLLNRLSIENCSSLDGGKRLYQTRIQVETKGGRKDMLAMALYMNGIRSLYAFYLFREPSVFVSNGNILIDTYIHA